MNEHEQIQVDVRGNVAVVTLRGQFTGGEETDTMQHIVTTLQAGVSMLVVIDLADVTYVNSSFISSLLASQSNVSRRGGALVLSRVPEGLQRIFDVTRLSNVFRSFHSVDEAVGLLITEH